jgi:hypothetical protein
MHIVLNRLNINIECARKGIAVLIEDPDKTSFIERYDLHEKSWDT